MAIQVNGTTVIDNSRALTNISSVDSSVVSAMSSAGVGGGATSLITDWTSMSTSHGLILSLDTSYDIIRIYIDKLQVNNSNTNTPIKFRLQTSVGIQTGYDYQFYRQFTGSWGQGATGSDNEVQFASLNGSGDTYPTSWYGYLEFHNHGDADKVTSFYSKGMSNFNYNQNQGSASNLLGNFWSSTARQHTGVQIINSYSSSYLSGCNYRVMGVKL